MSLKLLLIVNGVLLAAIVTGGLINHFSAEPAPLTKNQTAAPPAIHETPGDRSFPMSQSTKPSEQIPIEAQPQPEQQAGVEPQPQEADPSQEGEEAVIVTPPVAYLQPELSLVLNLEQSQAIQAVRLAFEKAMRNAGNPSSPEYLERWLVEQDRADELLKAYLGPVDFSRLHESVH